MYGLGHSQSTQVMWCDVIEQQQQQLQHVCGSEGVVNLS